MTATNRPDLSAPPVAPGGESWPVLARLPELGAGPIAPLPTFEQPPLDGLALVTDAPPLPEPVVDTREFLSGAPTAQRQYVDAGHVATPWPTPAPHYAPTPETAPDPVQRPVRTNPREVYRRIDQAQNDAPDGVARTAKTARDAAVAAPQPSRLTQALSTQAFDAHAALAPYASLIVTLALVAAAGLLYWLMLGPATAPAGASVLSPLQREWSQLDAEQAERIEAASAVTGQVDQPRSFKEAAQSYREADRRLVQATQPGSEQTAEASVADGPALNAIAPLPPAHASAQEATPLAPQQQPAQPADAGVYPSTGRVPFDMTEVAPARPVEVAERTDERGAPATTSR